MSNLLVSDFDRTFYLNDSDIEKNKIWVDKFIDKGGIFVIATGRSYKDFYDKLDIYKFNYNYVILNHGATILSNSGEILYNICIPKEIVSQIKINLDLLNCVDYFCCSKIDSRVDFLHENITKINVKYKNDKIAREKVKLINDKFFKYVNAYYVNNFMIEIISSKANKAKAIKILIEHLSNLIYPNVYVIGDGYSDIDMIKEFNGYCMKDSVIELKKIAKKEFASVSELIEEINNEQI